jgi:hypothetical protein
MTVGFHVVRHRSSSVDVWLRKTCSCMRRWRNFLGLI